MNLLDRVRADLLSPTFIKWMFVGVITVIIDVVLFSTVYAISLQVLFSNLVSTFGAMTFNFLTHKAVTFRVKGVRHPILQTAAKYLIQYAVTFILGTLLIFMLIPYLVADVAKFVSLIVVSPIGYVLMKNWVFDQNNR